MSISRGFSRRPGAVAARAARLACVTLLMLGMGRAPASAYEGFGAATVGGGASPEVEVSTLNDAGPGSLRAALLGGGNRKIIFTVGGTITLLDFLRVSGSNVTIDGTSAPSPGITLKNRGLIIDGGAGAHDVIVRGLRVRNASIDGIQIRNGAFNVVIDHVSIHGAGDGNIDITEGAHDVTVSWSILAEPASGKTMLIKYSPSRVSLHHNLVVKGLSRNPSVSIGASGVVATDTTVDMRNNVVWDWGPGWGTKIHDGAWANVINNFYASPSSTTDLDREQALIVCEGDCPEGGPTDFGFAYVTGNFSGDLPGVDINTVGTEATPYPAEPVTTTDTCLVAHQVVAGAGVRPLDALDQQYVSRVTPPTCVADLTLDTLTAPGSVVVGGTLAVSDRIVNLGTRAGENFVVGYYLSRDRTLDASDVPLGARLVTVLPAYQANLGAISLGIPEATAPGSYSLIARVDSGNAVTETSEANNVKMRTVKVTLPDLTVSVVGAPASAARGSTILLSDTTENRGEGSAPNSTTSYYLRDKNNVETFLVSRVVPPLDSRAKSASAAISYTVPVTLALGSYTIVVRADTLGQVREESETNNSRTRSITIK